MRKKREPTVGPWGPRTSFVGRERELSLVRAALDTSRLVTIVGAGGAGKTRLVLELMHRQQLACLFCDVSEASSLDAMRLALADALNVHDDGLAVALANLDEPVLVLDNLEQLLPDAATVVDGWLKSAPRLHIVATSRSPTHLPGEHIVEVEPLALPAASTLQTADACVLFVDRLCALLPGTSVSDEQWQRIGEIVTGLDGLPLAIELAAGRARVLSVHQIAEQLSHKLDALKSSDPLRPPRHVTLRAAVDWSWQLLDESERNALCQLSVFRGSFDLAAAAAVTTHTSAVDTLQSLCDQALLRVDRKSSVARYRLFECVRDFAREQPRDDTSATQERHDQHFDDIAQRGNTDELALCIDDLVDVHRRSLPNHPQRALRIVLALESLLLARGPETLLLRLLDETLAAASDGHRVAAAHLARGHVLADVGRFEESQAARERALSMARDEGDRQLEGNALASLGRHAWHSGRFDEALRLTNEALLVFRDLGDELLVAKTQSHRANFRWLAGDVEAARRDYLDALPTLRDAHDRSAEAIALGNLASLERDMGLIEDARAHFERSLALLTELGDRFHRGTFIMNLAGLLLENGDTEDARRAYQEALTLHHEAGNKRWLGIATASLAQCDEMQGNHVAAARGYATGAELAEQFGHPVMSAMVLCWRASFAADQGDVSLARRCLIRAESIFSEVGTTVVDDLADVARGHLALALAPSEGAHHVREAETILARLAETGGVHRSGELRVAVGRLEAAVDASRVRGATTPPPPTDALCVHPEALGFRVPGGRWQDLSTRGPLRRILGALADQRETCAGTPLLRAALVEAGWPGERIQSDAAATRVYTAIATLRRRGLRGILVRRDEGYALDPAVPLIRAPR